MTLLSGKALASHVDRYSRLSPQNHKRKGCKQHFPQSLYSFSFYSWAKHHEQNQLGKERCWEYMMVERSALTMSVMLLSLKLKEHWRRGSRKTVRAGRWGGGLGNTSSSHTTAVAIMTKTGLVNCQLWMVGSLRDCSPPPNHWLLIDFERGRGIVFRRVPVGEHSRLHRCFKTHGHTSTLVKSNGL